MRSIRVVAAASAVAVVMALGATSSASAAVLDSYCSPTGDYCLSIQESKRGIKFRIATFSFHGKYTLCVKGPSGKECQDFKLAQRGDQWKSNVSYHPEEAGSYAISWFLGGDKLGKTLRFVVNRDAAARSPRMAGFSGCGKVNDEGGRSPVKAAVISCEKARPIGKDFIKKDILKKGWKSYNPAGCEFFLYRRADQAQFDAWVDQGGVPTFKLIYLIRSRGCVS